jgi:hypothetical protein
MIPEARRATINHGIHGKLVPRSRPASANPEARGWRRNPKKAAAQSGRPRRP